MVPPIFFVVGEYVPPILLPRPSPPFATDDGIMEEGIEEGFFVVMASFFTVGMKPPGFTPINFVPGGEIVPPILDPTRVSLSILPTSWRFKDALVFLLSDFEKSKAYRFLSVRTYSSLDGFTLSIAATSATNNMEMEMKINWRFLFAIMMKFELPFFENDELSESGQFPNFKLMIVEGLFVPQVWSRLPIVNFANGTNSVGKVVGCTYVSIVLNEFVGTSGKAAFKKPFF